MADFKTPDKRRNAEKYGNDIKIPASPFLSKLGYGTGVSVLKLMRSPFNGQMRSPWAVKMINKNIKKTTIFGKRLREEAKLLKEMSHPNIVGFRFAKTGVGRLCLGMETCDSSLGDQIEKRLDENLPPYPPHNILKVALDIGKALDYIHTKVKILHGDIKSYNVLVNGDFEICKLCDFGVSLPLDDNGIVPAQSAENCGYVGTELWSAPEIFTGKYPISSKADIFSYGLCLWEMMSLSPPHIQEDEDLDQSVICLDDSNNALPTYGTRPAVPSQLDIDKYKLPLSLFFCVTEELPAARPDAHHAVLCAEDMLLHMPHV